MIKAIRPVLKGFLLKSHLTARILKQYRLMRYASKPKLTDVIIYTNSFCNASCSFCDVPKVEGEFAQGIAIPIHNTPLYMTEEIFLKILDDPFVTDEKTSKLISFLMTEPLLSKNLPQLLSEAKKRGHMTKVTTNGYLLSKRSESIYSNLDYLQVSIDGLEDLHDKIRGNGFFSRAIDGLKTIRAMSRSLNIEINITLSKINYHEAYELLLYIDNLGLNINEVRFQFLDYVSKEMSLRHNSKQPEITQGVTVSNSDVLLSDHEVRSLHNVLDQIRNFKPRSIGRVNMKPNLASETAIRDYFSLGGEKILGNDICYTPFTQLAVSTSGDVYWHMRCYNNYKLGNVLSTGVRDVFFGEKAEYFRNQFAAVGMCFDACTRCCGIISSSRVS